MCRDTYALHGDYKLETVSSDPLFRTFNPELISGWISTCFMTISLTDDCKTLLVSTRYLPLCRTDFTSPFPVLMTVAVVTAVSSVQSLCKSIKPFHATSFSCCFSEPLKERKKILHQFASHFDTDFYKNHEPTMA